jgi:hypothetical protein
MVALTVLKTAVVAPIPSASVPIAARVNAGRAARRRTLSERSLIISLLLL